MLDQISHSLKSATEIQTDGTECQLAQAESFKLCCKHPQAVQICHCFTYALLLLYITNALILGSSPCSSPFTNNITNITVLNSLACCDWQNLLILFPKTILCLTFLHILMHADNKRVSSTFRVLGQKRKKISHIMYSPK